MTAEPKKLPVRNPDGAARRGRELRDQDYFTQLAYRKPGGSRYTQDSPILADVLVHYGLLEDKSERLDLLLTPDWEKSPDAVAEELRCWLREPPPAPPSARRQATEGEPAENGAPPDNPYLIAYNQSVVAVRLTLEELVCYALPMSSWWQTRLVAIPGKDPVDLLTDPRLAEIARSELLEALRLEIAADPRASRDTPTASRPAPTPVPEEPAWERRHWLIRQELAWAARLFYLVRYSNVDGKWHAASDQPEPIAEELFRLIGLIAERRGQCARDERSAPPTEAWIYSINRNRPIERAVHDSVPTTKADAARTTFGVTGRGICWAVIDTGIDARHMAFRKRKNGSPYPKAFAKKDERNTRIRKTYDFSDIREKLSNARRYSLLTGRMLDWEELEDELKLRVEHCDERYQTPLDRHGTHVAGILAADWQPDLAAIDPLGPPPTRRTATRPIVGLCPEIELYDLRVFKGNRGDEFAVMSALQFVRSLNQRHDKLEIHGVNLSLAMLHEVSNYACGRSPVCEECTRLVGTGVVVVAAAGNQGRSIYTTTQNRKEEGYRTVSIADPGNAEAVITVGATHRREPHNYGVSYFSSRGPTGDGRSKPDLVAPGEKILSTVPRDGMAHEDGTSQAAPHVSGAAALLMSRHRELTGQPGRIKGILMSTATDLGRERHFQGAGLVDVLRAIQSV